jgi:hypothetical protein
MCWVLPRAPRCGNARFLAWVNDSKDIRKGRQALIATSAGIPQRNGTERQELVLKPGDAERSSDLRPRFKFEPQNGHSKFWSRQLGEVSTAPMFVPVHTVRVAATNETFAIQTLAAKRLIPTRVKYIWQSGFCVLGNPFSCPWHPCEPFEYQIADCLSSSRQSGQV